MKYVEQLVNTLMPFQAYAKEATTYAKRVFPNARFVKPNELANMFGSFVHEYKLFPACTWLDAKSKLPVMKTPILQISIDQGSGRYKKRRYLHNVNKTPYPLMTIMVVDATINTDLFYALAIPERTFQKLFYPLPEKIFKPFALFGQCNFCSFRTTCPISIYEGDKDDTDGNHNTVLDFIGQSIDTSAIRQRWNVAKGEQKSESEI